MEIDAPTYLSGRGQSFLGWKSFDALVSPRTRKAVVWLFQQ